MELIEHIEPHRTHRTTSNQSNHIEPHRTHQNNQAEFNTRLIPRKNGYIFQVCCYYLKNIMKFDILQLRIMDQVQLIPPPHKNIKRVFNVPRSAPYNGVTASNLNDTATVKPCPCAPCLRPGSNVALSSCRTQLY